MHANGPACTGPFGTQQLADQTLNADGCPATEIIPLPVRHVDAFNGAITTFEVERLCLRTAADHTLHIKVVRIAIGIDDR